VPLASTSQLSYYLEPDGLTHKEIAIIEESLQERTAGRKVADDAEREDQQ